MVNNANNQQLFTRDGNFTQNAAGVLQTANRRKRARLDRGRERDHQHFWSHWQHRSAGRHDSAAPATQNFSIDANLSASGVAATSTGTFSAPMQVVDSLGNTHNLTITFTRSAASPNTWSYDVTIPGGDLTGGTAREQQSVLAAPGTVRSIRTERSVTPAGTAPVSCQYQRLGRWCGQYEPSTGINSMPTATDCSPNMLRPLISGRLPRTARKRLN